MGEMISSFDGTKLYLNKEAVESPKAVLVIVHRLCSRKEIWRISSTRQESPPIGLTTGAMGAPRGRGRITMISMNCWMIPMWWWIWL